MRGAGAGTLQSFAYSGMVGAAVAAAAVSTELPAFAAQQPVAAAPEQFAAAPQRAAPFAYLADADAPPVIADLQVCTPALKHFRGTAPGLRAHFPCSRPWDAASGATSISFVGNRNSERSNPIGLHLTFSCHALHCVWRLAVLHSPRAVGRNPPTTLCNPRRHHGSRAALSGNKGRWS